MSEADAAALPAPEIDTILSDDLARNVKSLFDEGKIGEALLLSDVVCKTDDSKSAKSQHLVIRLILHGRNKEHRKVIILWPCVGVAEHTSF